LGASNAPARIALLSLHTSPLAQPGSGDSGGMNVYIRELVGHLAHTGAICHVYVRAWHPDLPAEVDLEPGVRVVHISAGPYDLAKEELYDIVDEFADKVEADILAQGGVDVLHANYWLSGVAGHRIKHRLDIPLITTFHTLARVKAETGDHEPERRAQAEAQA
jgi:D-inositol-3-phosphate glycosyltransferase